MKRDYDREGYDVADWGQGHVNRPRFVELDELEDNNEFQKRQQIET